MIAADAGRERNRRSRGAMSGLAATRPALAFANTQGYRLEFSDLRFDVTQHRGIVGAFALIGELAGLSDREVAQTEVLGPRIMPALSLAMRHSRMRPGSATVLPDPLLTSAA